MLDLKGSYVMLDLKGSYEGNIWLIMVRRLKI
jgi:hypothetical protein